MYFKVNIKKTSRYVEVRNCKMSRTVIALNCDYQNSVLDKYKIGTLD